MGTRSNTIIKGEDGRALVNIYRQYDGYPSGMGLDLAKACDVRIVNGIRGDHAKIANGMGCLAARIIKRLKTGAGNVYLENANGKANDWSEYVYTITFNGLDNPPLISCRHDDGRKVFERLHPREVKAWVAKQTVAP